MKAVIQRVTQANVSVSDNTISEIGLGLMVLLGISNNDTIEDAKWLCKKLINLRIFDDDNDVMNLSVKDVNGDILIVSQFTLQASTKKGNRPSYINAAKPDIAIPLYKHFLELAELELGKAVQSGVFGANMQVSLRNDGPVTIIIDTKNKE